MNAATLPALPPIVRLLRPGQWTKNSVVLAAFFFAFGEQTQQGAVTASLWTALAAAALFCLASSGIYVLNDILDAEQDRQHPHKRYRPVAAGTVSMPTAWVLSVVLLVVCIVLAWLLSTGFSKVVLGYIVLQLIYSTVLKRIAMVDAFVIATGFVLRALAGALAINVSISPWLLLCTFLLALFLALCKRRHEKIQLHDAGELHRASLGQYSQQLLDQLIAIVSAATIVSYAIYTLWPETIEKFGTPYLGLTIPIVIFGIFRYLDLVYRHDEGGRPDRILLTDIPLLCVLAIYGITVIVIFVV
jgi:4-hydroxybenzoate polyprenyltransferase